MRMPANGTEATRRVFLSAILPVLTIVTLPPISDAQTSYSNLTTLYKFTGGSDGSSPFASVVVGPDGVLYGTTRSGGSNGGTIFQLEALPWGGDWKETTIYTFPPYSAPSAALAVGKKGELYGTAYFGGSNHVGSVFELDPPTVRGAAWTESTIYSFSPANGDPQNPSGGVIIGNNGVLYGTTQFAGISSNCGYYGCGAVYSLSPPASPGGAWTYNTIYTFMGGSDGAITLAGVILGNHGELYGSTYSGGPSLVCSSYEGSGCGTVFELSPPGDPTAAWTEEVLYSFTGGSDGGFPSAVTTRNGRIYGMTKFGGDLTTCGGFGCGTVFELTPSGNATWTRTTLLSFKGAPDGLYPSAGYIASLLTFSSTGVTFGIDGSLYGTTPDGGTSLSCPENPGCGTVFQLAPGVGLHHPWIEHIIHSFDETDGFRPYTSVVVAPDGTLYGTTPYGGLCLTGCGTVFAVKPTTLMPFTTESSHD